MSASFFAGVLITFWPSLVYGKTLPVTTVMLERPAHKVSFRVEVARTPSELGQGLMKRKVLAPDTGMIFIFPTPQRVSFWMKDTLIPLDMLFINQEGVLVQVYEKAEALSLKRISSHNPVKYVLEFPAGTLQNSAILVGDKLSIGKE